MGVNFLKLILFGLVAPYFYIRSSLAWQALSFNSVIWFCEIIFWVGHLFILKIQK
jgi:hypothetical protein